MLANKEKLLELLNADKQTEAEALKAVSAYLSQYTIVDISSDLSLHAVTRLAAALAENTTLQSLRLEFNNIGPVGAEHIGIALAENKTLQSLDLGYNKIGPDGTRHIGAALTKNETLQSLDLCANNIDSVGAEHIGLALAQNKSLQSLDLGCNNIGRDGARHIGAALEKNTTLQSLSLDFTHIDPEVEQRIQKTLELHKHHKHQRACTLGEALHPQPLPLDIATIIGGYDNATSSASLLEAFKGGAFEGKATPTLKELALWELDVMELSEYFGGLREKPTLFSVQSNIQKLHSISRKLENLEPAGNVNFNKMLPSLRLDIARAKIKGEDAQKEFLCVSSNKTRSTPELEEKDSGPRSATPN